MSISYEQLLPCHIRLIEFLDDSGLDCRLVAAPLGTPPYVTLSYTWEKIQHDQDLTSKDEHTITFKSHRVTVQRNLYDAMRYLGSMVRQRGYMFWADAVCINQSDKQELGQQVSMMRTIYEHSSTVLAWLGSPIDDCMTMTAVGLTKIFLENMLSITKGHEDINNISAHDSLTEDTFGFPKEEHSKEWVSWMTLKELFSRPYWNRTWIHQEMTTPVPTLFFCGSYSFDRAQLWATMLHMMGFASISQSFSRTFLLREGSHQSIYALNHIHQARTRGAELQLLNQLRIMRNTNCTEPRDRIYAALGLVSDVSPEQIPVDYTSQLMSVYTNVFQYALEDSNLGLAVLSDVDWLAQSESDHHVDNSGKRMLPSWMPDWNAKTKVLPLAIRDKRKRSIYNPCPGAVLAARIDGAVLEVNGFVLDGIGIRYLTSIGNSFNDLFASEDLRRWYSDMQDAAGAECLTDSLLRASVADASYEGSNPMTARYLTDGFTYQRGYAIDWELINSPYKDLEPAQKKAMQIMAVRMNWVCGGRRMGLTTDGRVGVFPAAAVKNDIVALFHAGPVLYVVRPAPNTAGCFEFVGECYVDGLMDGEAVASNGTHDQPAVRTLRLV